MMFGAHIRTIKIENRFCSMCSLLLVDATVKTFLPKKRSTTVWCLWIRIIVLSIGIGPMLIIIIIIITAWLLSSFLVFILGQFLVHVECGHNILLNNIFFLLLLLFQNFSRTATIRRRRKRDLKMNRDTHTKKKTEKKKKWTRILLHMQTGDIDIHNRKKLTLFGNDQAWKWKLPKPEF